MLDPFSNHPDPDPHFELNLPHADANRHSEIAHLHPADPLAEPMLPPPVKQRRLTAENIALLVIIGLLLLIGSGVWTHLNNVQQADQRRHVVLMDSLIQVKTNLESHLNQLELAFTDLQLEKDTLATQLASATNIVAEKESMIQQIKKENVQEEKSLRAQVQRLQSLNARYETIIAVMDKDNAVLHAENAQLNTTATALSEQVSELGRQLENQLRKTLSAQYKASAFRLELARRNDKLTVRARRTRELKVIFELNDVPAIYQGNQQLYLVITNDQGLPITSPNPTHTTIRTEKGEVAIVSQATQLKNVIDNQRVILTYKLEDRLKKGTYIVSVYSERGLLGVASFRLS